MIALHLLEFAIARLELYPVESASNLEKTFERMSHGLRSCFVLTSVCDLLPCTTGEFHLPMDEVADNESHWLANVTFDFLSYLVSVRHTGNVKLLVCKIYSHAC